MTSQSCSAATDGPSRTSATGPFSDPRLDALLLDVDGTLIDIALTPETVHVPEPLIFTLSQLQQKYAGAFALVSGRRLADLDRMFRPLSFAAVGSHGAELRPSTLPGMSVVTASPLPQDLRQSLAALAGEIPSVRLEDKAYTIALHYRRTPEQEVRLRVAIATTLGKLGYSDLEVLSGKEVFEVKPRSFNKGIATLALMNTVPFRGRRPVFLGDDVTDEDVFAILPEFDGLGISVGRHIDSAEWTFESPRQVRAWLGALAAGEAGTLQ
ncbi:MAG: trehalose-phosphatase [Proteobacteria bacterium]|nr:trehalose-phosphatase [Pseudomonadota bacterium]